MRNFLQRWILYSLLLLISTNLFGQARSSVNTDFSSGIPTGWVQDATGVTLWSTSSSGFNTGSGTLTPAIGTAYAVLSASTNQAAVKLISTSTDASTFVSPVLSITYAIPQYIIAGEPSNDTLKVYYRTSTNGTWNLLQTLGTPSTQWTNAIIPLTGIGNLSNVQIALEHNYGSGRAILIDEVYIGAESICTTPIGLNANRITSNSAQILWSGHSMTELYSVKVDTMPITDFSATASVLDVSTPNFFCALTNLQPSKSYYFYVKADCGDNDITDWSTVGTFTTLCNDVNVPYTQDFENVGIIEGISYPNCWNRMMVRSGFPSGTSPSIAYNSHCTGTKKNGLAGLRITGSYYFSDTFTSPRITKGIATTPSLNVADIASLQVTFWYYSSSLSNKLYVGVMTDPNDESSFQEIATIQVTAASAWQQITLPLSNATAGKFVAFMVDGGDIAGTTTSTYQQTSIFYIDDVLIEEQPACPSPKIIVASNVTTNGCDLTWASYNATSWEMKISKNAMTDMTANANVFNGTVNSNPYALTGLSPNMTYFIYLRSNCGTDGYSEWSQAATVSTLCDNTISDFPYLSNFDDIATGGFSECWYRPVMYNGYPKVTAFSTLTVNSAPHSLEFRSASSSNPSIAVTPAINSSLNSLMVTCWMRAESTTSSGVMDLGYMTDPQDPTTFTLIETVTPMNNNITYYEFFLSNVTDTNLGNHIAFRHRTSSSSYYYWVDDVKIDSLPSCFVPLKVRASQLTDSSASIIWNHVEKENSWQVKVSSTLMTDLTATADIYDNIVSNPNVTINGLNANTNYYVYVRSACHTDVNDGWASVYNIKTKCSPLAMIPQFEDFESYGSNSYPDCWSRPLIYSTYPKIITSSNNNVLRIAGNASNTTYAVSQPIDVELNTLQVSFDLTPYSITYGGRLEVGVMPNPEDTTTFELVKVINAKTTAQERYYINLNNIALRGLGNCIAIRNVDNSSSSYYWTIDNFKVDYLPSCITPTTLQLDNLTATTAQLSWTPENGETSWNVKISKIQLLYPSDVNAFVLDTTINTTTLTASNLQMGTKYYFYLQSQCTDTVGLWEEIVFTTPCSSITTLPLANDFENETVDVLPNCWTLLYASTSPKVTNNTNSFGGSGNSIYFSGGNAMIAAPEIGLDIHTVRVSFYLSQEGASSGKMHVGVMGDNSDINSFELIDSILVPTYKTQTFYQYDLDATTLTGNSWYFAFKQVTSTAGWYFWLDNLSIELIPSCNTVTNLTYSSLLDTSITVSWAGNDNAISYEYCYGVRGFVPEGNNVTIYSTTQTQAHIGSLTPQTNYDLYVRSICSVDDVSTWTALPLMFTTCTTPESIPLVTDFENATDNANWILNNSTSTGLSKWVIGKGTSASYSNTALYISKDTGMLASHEYNGSSTANVYAYRTVILTPGMYTVEYDWIGEGESTYDYARFALVDPSESLTAGTIASINTGVMPSGKWEIDLADGKLNLSSTWNSVERQFMVNETKIYNLVLYWINDGSVTNNPSFAIDNLSITRERDCRRPKDLSVSRLTYNSAKIMWFSQNGSSFNIKVSSTPIDPEVQDGDFENITGSYYTDNYYDLSDLLPNTTYYFYVQADCGTNEPSVWSRNGTFTTLCAPQALPYTDNFNSYDPEVDVLPSCWFDNYDVFGAVTNNYSATLSKQHPNDQDSMCVKIQSYYYSSTNSTSGEITMRYVKNNVILPEFDEDMNKMYMDFTAYSTTDKCKLRVGVLADPSDMSTFILIDTIDVLKSWNTYTVSFEDIDFGDDYNGNPSTQTTGFISFLLDGASDAAESTMYISNIHVDTISACKAPVSMNVVSTNGNGATLSWKPMSMLDNNWRVQISTVNHRSNVYDLDTDDSIVIDTLVSGSQITVSGLKPNTTYYYYVRPICENNVEGPRFKNAVSFRTDCGVEELPYVESFDSYGTGTGTMVACWDRYYTNVLSTLYPYINSVSASAPGSLYFYATDTTYTYVVLPELDINDLSLLTVSMKARASSLKYYLKLGVMTNPADLNTFTEVSRISVSEISVWQDIIVHLNSYSGNAQYIALLADSTGMLYIDDLIVEESPLCFMPKNVSVLSSTSSSIDVSWGTGNNETSWEVVYGNLGFDPNSATPISVLNSTYTISGLNPSSIYQIYVRANCGITDGYSEWYGPVLGTTTQLPATIPYNTDFEGTNGGWTIENGTQGNQFTIGNDQLNGAYSGNDYLYITNDNGNTCGYTISGATSAVFAYRKFGFDVGRYVISFQWKAGGESSFDYGRFFFTPGDASFTAGSTMIKDTVNVNARWIDLNAANNKKRKMNMNTSWKEELYVLDVTTAGEYNLAFGWCNDYGGGDGLGLCIDDIKVQSLTCMYPTISVDSATATSIKVNWTSDNNNSIIKVSTTSLSLEEIATATADVLNQNVTTNTYTLSGLTPETDYYIYVSNLCSTTDTSIWVSYAITTPAMLPYACDFEQANHSWIFVNGTQGNKFVVDTAIAFGGNKSLYISDNEGVSNTYSTPTSLSSTVYAYKEVYFEPGTYEISYQWRCLGEVSNDYARVFLFPSNKSLTAGTNILYTVSNPTNALAVLDQNVQLNNSAAWQENQTRFKVNAAGIYKVVVGWRNSNSVNNNPPIAIDDVVIEEVMCSAPLVQTSDITISSASLEWFSNSDTILFKVSKELFTLEQIDTVTNNLICNEKIFNKNYALSGLEDYTTYYIYSRVLCSSGDTSEWNIEPFTTQLMVINAPCSFDFETDAKFYLVNGNQRNYFVVGNGVSANGNNSLYITNDGTLNAYSTNLSSVVYATKVINFEQGEYIISYNWLCNAESGYDYGRVFLAPETATITNSTSFMSLTSAPTGWIALDNYAQMSNNTSWSNQEVEFNISTTGNYQLVIGWTNDGSMGVNPPLAIDDIEITKVACMAPIVTTDSITTDAIYLDVVSQTDSFVIFISSTLHSDMYLETVQTTDHVGNKFDFQGLSSQTNYYIYTRSVCSDSTFSNWAINLFRTSCADIYINDTLSYVENFDSYGTLSNTQPECWFNNTTSSYVYPNISTTKYNGVGSLYFYGSSLVTTYSATSKIEGTPINELMMTLRLQVSTLSYHILVGVMSNPDDVNTFITVDSLYCSAISIWEYKEVDFSNYSGEGKHIAFKVGGKVVSYAYVDNVEIMKIPACPNIRNLEVESVTTTNISLSWDSHATNNQYQVKLFVNSDNIDPNTSTALIDTIVNTNSINMTVTNGMYIAYVRRVCSDTEQGNWADIKVVTSCQEIPLPYFESLSGEILPPTCWERYSSLLSSVINGGTLSSSSSGWNRTTVDQGIIGTHMRTNNYGGSHNAWLTTPTFIIDTTAILSFDLALTKYSDATADPTSNFSQSFMVLVSDDAGQSWNMNNATVWNDSIGDHGFLAIPKTAMRYSVDLGKYVGNEIMIAFYSESRRSGGDNFIHLGNVAIKPAASSQLYDDACLGYGYTSNGFNIDAAQMPTSGVYNFSKMVPGATTDSIVRITITVHSNDVTYLTDSMCSGDVYTKYGFQNITAAGTYRRVETSSFGCDSALILTLTVIGGSNNETEINICESELPYQWRGKNYNATGVYNDTTVGNNGCDVIHTLILHVNREYHFSDNYQINDTDLPFVYLDTIFTETTPRGSSTHVLNRKTQAGCDSIYTVTLDVRTVSLTDVYGNDFLDIYPNPIRKDGEVILNANISEAELYDLVVEVFNSAGERVKVLHPETMPILIKDFEASGVYMVRVITNTNRVIYGKVIVK